MSKENRHFYEFGPFRIDTLNRQLLRDDQVVPLKAKAVETLLLLIQNRGDVIEKDEAQRQPAAGVEPEVAAMGERGR